jgi:hypothetical protein
MKLKNWAYLLFKPCEALYHIGFEDVRLTPAIIVDEKMLSPDIIAWSDAVTLVLDGKSGKPDPDSDSSQAKEYLQIPKETLEKYFQRPVKDIEVVLLYLEKNLRDKEVTSELLGKIMLERKIIVWSLERLKGEIRLNYGTHSRSDLNDLLNSGIPVPLIPPPHIFLQPDSPLRLIARELFLRLLQRAYRNRTKHFSLDEAEKILESQVYAFSDREQRTKLKRAIGIGAREDLCRSVAPNSWELNLVLRNPERYLEKLNQLIKRKTLEEFLEK